MKFIVLFISSCCLTACFATRSIVVGQTAAALGAGKAEVGLSSGVGVHFQSSGPRSNSGVTIPWPEGNLHFGLSEQTGFNVHLSPAGLQPGVKVTWAKEDIAFAILPEAGFGLATGSASTTGVTQNTSTTLTALMIGSKFLLSHRNGVFCAAGYDFQSWTVSADNSSVTETSHAISFAIGYDAIAGLVNIRPELAFLISPTSSINRPAATGSSQVSLIPTVTIALQTGRRRAP